MIKKYIRGNSTRGDEVIRELEKLGGVNHSCIVQGNVGNNIYFINKQNEIVYLNKSKDAAQIIIELFEEIHLPEEFTPEEFVIVTEKEKRGCDGCIFENLSYGNCMTVKKFFGDCKEKGIIFKLK